ncbi:MAG: hypothetical protein QOJ64_3730 [Acidobacteriota bacterium]|jgi:hypothetical protein|nr:hypothetical protein [Acidobacteriota bacterium]
MPKDFIVTALKDRFAELLNTRIAGLLPERYGPASDFVADAKRQLLVASSTELSESFPKMTAPVRWMEGDFDSLAYLRRLSLGEPLDLRFGAVPSLPALLLDDLSNHDASARFQLLSERYACPLNFTLPAEDGVREWVLTRLMVQDRALIEKKNSLRAIHAEDLLLKLNLVALQACAGSDLRFLDALNYYYELLPSAWHPPGQYDWLLVSYFCLYARALAAWISR